MTLLGAHVLPANFDKNPEHLTRLKERLARIGIPKTSALSTKPIYFDCCLELTRLRGPQRVQERRGNRGGGEIDEDEPEDAASQSYATQPEQPPPGVSRKRGAMGVEGRGGKKPCRDPIVDTKDGMTLRGQNDAEPADFEAHLVYTKIMDADQTAPI